MHYPTERIAHTTAFVTTVVKHWLEGVLKGCQGGIARIVWLAYSPMEQINLSCDHYINRNIKPFIRYTEYCFVIKERVWVMIPGQPSVMLKEYTSTVCKDNIVGLVMHTSRF